MPQEPPSGRPPQDTDAEILAVFHSSSDPVLGTREVTESLSIDIDATRLRLQQLQETGDIAGKTIGDRRVWWLPARVREESRKESDFEKHPSPEAAEGIGLLESLDLPGDDQTIDARREAVGIVFREIVYAEQVPTTELREEISDFPEKAGYGDIDGLWNNTIWEALNQAPFFLPDKKEDQWVLSKTGRNSKRLMPDDGDDDLLGAFEAGYKKKVFEVIWRQFRKTIRANRNHFTLISRDLQDDNIAVRSPYIPEKLHFEFTFTDSIIHGIDGYLLLTVELVYRQSVLEQLTEAYHDLPERIRDEFRVEVLPVDEPQFHKARNTSEDQTSILSFQGMSNESTLVDSKSKRLLQVTGTRHVDVQLDTMREFLRAPSNPFEVHSDFIVSKTEELLQVFETHLPE